jgi:hypothetical protein
MAATKDTLLTALDALEQALDADGAGREQEWARRVEQALAAVEQAAQQRDAALRAPADELVPVDRPRLPSPAVDRYAAELRQTLANCRREAAVLRGKVQGAAEGLAVDVKPSGLAGALPVAPEAGAAADLGVFQQRARKLLQDLRKYRDDEVDVILEGVNTDVGSPD